MLFFGKGPKPNNESPADEPKSDSSWMRSIANLFPFGKEKDPVSIQHSDIDKSGEKELSKLVQKSETTKDGSLLGLEHDLADRARHRERIDKLLSTITAKPNSWKDVLSALPKIDLAYAEPGEKGLMVNTIMPARYKSGVQDAIVRITNSLLVDIRQENEHTKAFLDQIDDFFISALGLSIENAKQKLQGIERSRLRGDRSFDGCLVASGGQVFASNTPRSWLNPIKPKDGIESISNGGEPVLFVNGLNMSVFGHLDDMRTVADAFGCKMIGIHNAKQSNPASEFARAFNDAHNRRGNPTIDTVRDQILSAVYQDASLLISAESHGAGIVSRGVQRAISILKGKGWSEERVFDALQKIKVDTYAGATWEYPDGPQYSHYVLRTDPVPYKFGVTMTAISEAEKAEMDKFFESRKDSFFAGLQRFAGIVQGKHPNPRIHPGKGARVFVLDTGEPIERDESPHDIMSYVSRRIKLENTNFIARKKTGTDDL